MTKIILVGVWIVSLVLAFMLGRGNTPAAVDLESEAPKDMAAAITTALSQGRVLARFGDSARTLEHLNAENLPEVLDVYERMLSGLDDCDIRSFVDAWTEFDPRAAIDHTLAWEYSAKRVTGSNAAMRGWATRNPIEARAAFSEVIAEYPRLRNRILDNLLVGWAHANQDGLAEYVAGISTTVPEKHSAQVVNAILRRGGPEAVTDWVEEVVTDADYEEAFKRAVFRAGTRSSARWRPAWAADYVGPHLGEPWAADGPRIVAEQWGRQDGLAALTWAGTLEEGRPREEAVRAAFVEWFSRDRNAAEAWLMGQELRPFHDPALAHYAPHFAKTDPLEAVSLCEKVFDEGRRLGCLRRSSQEWYAVDPIAAEAWLQDSPLDEETRRGIRQAKSKRRQQEGAGSKRAAKLGGAPARRN